MATNTYIAVIHKDSTSDFGVSFPDLPGCVSAASTLDEVLSDAKEALALHIEGMLEEGEEIPIPTPADNIDRGDALLLAAIDVPDTLKVERINVTVPAIALTRFDAFAMRRGMTRSALFVEAVNRWLTARISPESQEEPALMPPPRIAFSAAQEVLAEQETKKSAKEALANVGGTGWLEDIIRRAADPSWDQRFTQAMNLPFKKDIDTLTHTMERLLEVLGRLDKGRVRRRSKTS